MSDDLGLWPEKVYLLRPSIKSFGGMVTNPERREYVLADRIEQLEERNKELTLQLLATSGQAADALDKLAKAVEALRVVVRLHDKEKFNLGKMSLERSHVFAMTRTVLAELEGKE